MLDTNEGYGRLLIWRELDGRWRLYVCVCVLEGGGRGYVGFDGMEAIEWWMVTVCLCIRMCVCTRVCMCANIHSSVAGDRGDRGDG